MKTNKLHFRSSHFLAISLCFLSICCKQPDELITTTSPNDSTGSDRLGAGLILIPAEDYAKLPVLVSKTYSGGRKASMSKIDLAGQMPPVDELGQGKQGSCVGWAVAYALRSWLYNKQANKSYKLLNGIRDDDAVFSPSYIYNQLNLNFNDKGVLVHMDKGCRIDAAFELLKKQGVCTLKDMPYNVQDYKTDPNSVQVSKASNYKIDGYGTTIESVESYKALLTDGFPIVVSLKNDPNIHKAYFPKDHQTLYAPPPGISIINKEFVWKKYTPDPENLWHAIVIVGFDDDMNAFKLMNSWGNGWANNGFIWMDYKLLSEVTHQPFLGYSFKLKETSLKIINQSTEYAGTGSWAAKSSPTSAYNRMNDASFIIDNILYTCGQDTDSKTVTWAYDSQTDKWAKKADVPFRTTNLMSAFTLNGKGYLVTSGDGYPFNVPSQLFEYSPISNTWTKKNPLPVDVGFGYTKAVAFSYNGKGYYGFNASGVAFTDAENEGREVLWEYNPTSDQWTKKTSLPGNWVYGPAQSYGVINDRLYVVFNQSVHPLVDNATLLYEYNLTTNSWSQKQTLLGFKSWGECVNNTVLNGKLYYGPAPSQSLIDQSRTNNMFVYDPNKDKWTELKIFSNTFRNRMTSVTINGKIYAGFGYGASVQGLNDWWEFTP